LNRPLIHAADGSVVLRPRHLHRALAVVCGETSLEELEDALCEAGFVRASLLSAAPADWRRLAPRDWPKEPTFDLAANECLVRIMGAIEAPQAVGFGPDMPLPSGASFTLAQVWEYAPAIGREGAGAAPPATPTPDRGHPGAGDGVTGLLVTAATLLGIGWVLSRRAEERSAREQTRLMAMIEREERDAIASRALRLEAEGMDTADALAVAEEEANPASITVADFREQARELELAARAADDAG
jgi:hypothetical protein